MAGHFRTALVAGFALACLAGCDSGPKIVSVTGVVTRGGKPVPNLFLNFMPDYGRPSWAITDSVGAFKLNYDAHRDGAVVGKHTVWVQWRSRNPIEEQEEVEGRLQKPAELDAILAKYGNEKSTPLQIEVSSKNRVLKIELD